METAYAMESVLESRTVWVMFLNCPMCLARPAPCGPGPSDLRTLFLGLSWNLVDAAELLSHTAEHRASARLVGKEPPFPRHVLGWSRLHPDRFLRLPTTYSR